jgi:hypothetical protein
MAKSTAVISPNLGLYYDRPSLALEPRMLKDGLNFRVKEGRLTNLNLGWTRFSDFTLNGPVTLIDNFFIRGLEEQLIFGTQYDLYVYDAGDDAVYFITPIYSTGTASANGTAVTGVGTAWSTEAKIGDEISFGASDENDPAATWHTVEAVGGDLSITLSASAGIIANGPYTLRQKFTGSFQDTWDTETFVNASDGKDWWVATNGIDNIIKWDGQTAQVEDAGITFQAFNLTVYSNMMVYANITQSGTRLPSTIINSNVGEPFNVTGGISEQFKVHSGTDGIMNIAPIGDNMAIYSSGTVTIAQFVGDPLIFVFRQAVSGIGAIASRAIADFGDFHEFVGNDSQYTFDGVTLQETGSHVWREILRQQDPSRIAFAFSHFDEESGDLIWSIPSTSDPGSGSQEATATLAWVEHYLEDVGDEYEVPFSKREFPFTSSGYYQRQEGLTWDELTDMWSELNFRWNDQFFFSAFPLNLVGDFDGKVYTLGTQQNKVGGDTLASHVTFGRRAIGDGRMRGLVSRVYPFASPFATPLDVVVYLSDHAQGSNTITHTEEFDQTLPEGGHFVSIFRRGRFMELGFSAPGPSEPYEIAGYDIDIKAGGMR